MIKKHIILIFILLLMPFVQPVQATLSIPSRQSLPLSIPADRSMSITAGQLHTALLRLDGTVAATGSGGMDVNNVIYNPCDVYGWTNIVAVSSTAYGEHTIGLKNDGTAVAVGKSTYGACNVSAWDNIAAVAAGRHHSLGLKLNGTVIATEQPPYERNFGQCNVSGLSNIIAISAGIFHSVFLSANGTVSALGPTQGYYSYGQCDVQGSGWTDIVAISAGDYHTVGLKSNGTVVAAGNNTKGQCNVSGWTNIVAIAAGGYHTIGLKSDGTVVAVGNTGFDPNDPTVNPCNVSSWTGIIAIAAGENHTVGLKANGSVVAVGDNTKGQCDVANLNIHNNKPFVQLKTKPASVAKGDSVYTTYSTYNSALTDKELVIISAYYGTNNKLIKMVVSPVKLITAGNTQILSSETTITPNNAAIIKWLVWSSVNDTSPLTNTTELPVN